MCSIFVQQFDVLLLDMDAPMECRRWQRRWKHWQEREVVHDSDANTKHAMTLDGGETPVEHGSRRDITVLYHHRPCEEPKS